MAGARALILMLLALPLAACGHDGESVPAADLPEGAIEVRDGYYMVPITEDDDGCMMYRAHAPGMMTDQAIRYRRTDGSFTTDKEEAACDGRE